MSYDVLSTGNVHVSDEEVVVVGIKVFSGLVVLALVLDYLWIAVVMKDFYLRALAGLGRLTAEGRLDPVLWAAGLVYVLIPLAVTYFVVLPSHGMSLFSTALRGAFLGICLYGVYDLTNLATLRGWTLSLAVVDMLWGAGLCATLGAVGHYFYRSWA